MLRKRLLPSYIHPMVTCWVSTVSSHTSSPWAALPQAHVAFVCGSFVLFQVYHHLRLSYPARPPVMFPLPGHLCSPIFHPANSSVFWFKGLFPKDTVSAPPVQVNFPVPYSHTILHFSCCTYDDRI